MAEQSSEKKHSFKDMFTHHDPAKHHDHHDSGKGKTSASAMKTEEADGGHITKQRSPGLWQRYKAHAAKENARYESDDIWGHYHGPGH